MLLPYRRQPNILQIVNSWSCRISMSPSRKSELSDVVSLVLYDVSFWAGLDWTTVTLLAAGMVSGTDRCDHITPVVEDLY